MRVEPISIGEVDVQPSVMVIVEKGQSASLGLNDGPFMVDAAPHIGNGEPGLLGHIHKLDRRCRGRSNRSLQQIRVPPSPERSGKSLCQIAAEQKER